MRLRFKEYIFFDRLSSFIRFHADYHKPKTLLNFKSKHWEIGSTKLMAYDFRIYKLVIRLAFIKQIKCEEC